MVRRYVVEGTGVKCKMAEEFETLLPLFREKYPVESDVWPESDVSFLEELLARDLISYNLHKILLSRLELPPEPEVTAGAVLEEYRREIGDRLFDKISGWFNISWDEFLKVFWSRTADASDWFIKTYEQANKSFWFEIKNIPTSVGMNVEDVFFTELSENLKKVVDRVGAWSQKGFEELQKLMMEEGHIKPEDSPAIAGKAFATCAGFGVSAHMLAMIPEVIHPIKHMGTGYLAAFLCELGGFGRIAAATMGVLTGLVIRQPYTYYINEQFRPQIPDDKLLIELRSKREIDKPDFDKAMAHQGFSNDWIDVIERWQWKDPRMFELMRVADVGIDQGPVPSGEMWWFTKFGVTGEMLKDWWLYRKLMRAGYEDCDLPVLIRTIHRREYAFAITYVRTAIRRNYRWGYLTDEGLDYWMEKMGLPKEAMKWIHWAGELDHDYFYRRDLENHYVLAFRNDVIDEDELTVSLLAMGLSARHVVLSVRTEKVRKRPKISKPVSPAAKKAMTDLQKKSITLYITQYRKDLITSEKLLESLLAIGLEEELAEISVDIEAAKKGLPEPS